LLPSSKSCLVVYDIPWYMPNSTEPITTNYIETVMRQSSHEGFRGLLSAPRIVHNGRSLDTARVYFDISDTQSGVMAKKMVNRYLAVGPAACRIMPAPIRVGTPLCDRCWKWGHTSLQCRKLSATCAHCGGPHELKNHREFAVCCRPQPKNKPPIP